MWTTFSESNDALIEEEGDTDGVAVISDDDERSSSGSPTPSPPLFSVQASPSPRDPETSSVSTIRDSEDELPEDFYLSEKKNKSYVHRRNNRVSNLLNIVLLGTVVTAITLAVGFMWGINDTCSLDMLNSVNRILTNLQKLQHENDVLKNKIKMMQYMRHKPIKSDLDFERFLQHEMFENNILYDLPQKVDKKFNPRNMLNKFKNHDIKRSEIEVLDYDNLEINDSDDAFLEAENVSKGSKGVPTGVCSDQSPQNGQETCHKKETKPEFNNVYHYSQEINTPLKPKETKDKNSGKDAKKAEKKKAKKAKKQKKRKMQRIAAIDEDYETSEINNVGKDNNEINDWYNKLYSGRQIFREKGMDYYIWQNKAKWYFKRMNRQKYRRNHQKYKVYT